MRLRATGLALTGRAAAVALVGVVVVLAAPVPVWALIVIEGAIAVGVAADVVLAAALSRVQVSRYGDSTVRLGETVELALIVENGSGRALRGVVRDAWPPSAGVSPSRHRLDIPAGERRRYEALARPTRRGERRADIVTIRSLGPLRLAGRQGSVAVPWALRVLPPFTSRQLLPAKLARLRELDGRTAARVRGQGTEFDSLRDYVIGDDVRSIDWRATARRQGVVVRTWRPERDRQLVLVLDTGRTSAARVGDAPRLDTSLDAALLLATLASRAGDRVDVVALDTAVRASVGGGARSTSLNALVSAVAPLASSLVESDPALLVSEVLRRARRRALVVLFTTLDAAPLQEGLLPVLPALTSRHAVILAAVADPAVDVMAATRGDVEAVYNAAAAEHTLTERHRMASDLRRRGVGVVDAPPHAFAGAVADAYLDLKAAGRL